MGSGDVDALSRSFRARAGLLGLLIVGTSAAAIWAATRDEGRGAPEQRVQLMIVTNSGEAGGLPALARGGFVVEAGSLEQWTELAREQVSDSEAEGIELVLELADERGFGFVVIEDPARFAEALGGLEVEPAPSEIDDFETSDFAVLSVGDFAFPHALTVGTTSEHPAVRLGGFAALDAVFEQPKIGARDNPELPTLEDLLFEDQTERGREMVTLAARFPATFKLLDAELRADMERAEGEGLVALSLLGPGLHTNTAIPTPDGGLISLRYELVPFSTTAETLELELGSALNFDWFSDRALAEGVREGEACTSLAGGSMPTSSTPQVAGISSDGSALALVTADGPISIWRKQPGPGCEWVQVGELPRGTFGERGALERLAPRFAADREPGQMGEAGVEDLPPPLFADVERGLVEDGPERELRSVEHLRVSSLDPRSGALEVETLLTLSGEGHFGSLVFVDPWRLAALTRREPSLLDGVFVEEHALVLVDRRHPQVRIRISNELFAPGRRLRELVLVSGGGPAGEAEGTPLGPTFLLTGRSSEGELELIELHIDGLALAEISGRARAEADAGSSEFSESMLLTLSPEDLYARVLVTRADLHSVAISPVSSVSGQGPRLVTLLARNLDRGPTQLAVLALRPEGGALQIVMPGVPARSSHYAPRVLADGRRVVFSSLTTVHIDADPFVVSRLSGPLSSGH